VAGHTYLVSRGLLLLLMLHGNKDVVGGLCRYDDGRPRPKPSGFCARKKIMYVALL